VFGGASDKDEIELGRLAAGEIEKDILLVQDPAVVKYIGDLGQSRVQKSTRKGIT
jgi:predicted Zn-dependent protease